ncbi:MAG: TonB-dependent receptor, partial [Methylocystaceae bacterium]
MKRGIGRFRRGLLSTTRLAPFALASAGLILGARLAPAHAEDATVEDVAVTARHREEKNQDVPLPISTVSGKALGKEQVYRVQDYVTKVPNFFAIQQNPRVSAVTIRGLGGNANSDGSESGVGVIVDNVFYTHVGFTWLDFVDLDHIEVVRGPQGTLLGKNTTIGSLIVSTKLPSFTRETTLETTYASRHRGQIRLNTTGAIIDDTLAYRVTFYGDKSDGWIDNQVNGQNFLDNNRFGIRAQFLLLAGNDIRNRLILEHYGSNEYNNFYPPIGDPTTFVGGGARAGWARKLIGLFGYAPSIDPGKNAALESQGRIRQNTDGVSNELNWQIGDHTFTSISAWRRFAFRPHNDSEYSPLPIFRFGYDVDVDQYSEELRLTSSTGQALEYQFGLYGLKEFVFSNNRTAFGQYAAPYFAGSLAVPSIVLDGVEYDQYGKATTTSGAVFGQATWHITERLALTAGIRDTVERKQGSNTAYAYSPGALPAALGAIRTAILNGFGGAFAFADAKTTNSVSWLVNPSYKINDNILAYFSVAQGEKSGAVNTGATPSATGAAAPVIILPERSTDFELGLKTTWLDGKLLLNGNLYWNDISNYQSAVADTTAPTYRSYLTNVGKVRLRGVELEARYSPVKNLWLTFGGAFNDARYVAYTDAPAPVEIFGGAGTANPAGVKSVDLSGRRVLGAPEFSGQIGINYEHPVDLPFGYRGVGFFWLSQTYRSGVALVNPLSSYGWQSAYGLTNLGVGVRSEDDRYSFQIWAKNVGDRRYFVGAGA